MRDISCHAVDLTTRNEFHNGKAQKKGGRWIDRDLCSRIRCIAFRLDRAAVVATFGRTAKWHSPSGTTRSGGPCARLRGHEAHEREPCGAFFRTAPPASSTATRSRTFWLWAKNSTATIADPSWPKRKRGETSMDPKHDSNVLKDTLPEAANAAEGLDGGGWYQARAWPERVPSEPARRPRTRAP